MSTIKHFFIYLFPSFILPVISLISVPLTTAVLNPEDFGFFALYNSYHIFLSSLFSLGAGYLWPGYFLKLDVAEKNRFVSTIFYFGFVFSIVCVILFWLSLDMIKLLISIDINKDLFLVLILISTVLYYPWFHAVEYITLSRKSVYYSFVRIASALMYFISMMLCLYSFKIKLWSLFISNLICVGFLGVCGILVLCKHLNLTFSIKWLGKLFTKGILTTSGNIAEQAATLIERNIINNNISTVQLGIYSHSQKYKTLLNDIIKSMGRSIWPVALKEADENTNFRATRLAWEPIYIIITFCAMACGMLGKEIISLLTFNKFTSSAILVTGWHVFLIIQNIGKEHTALLYNKRKSIFLTISLTISFIITIVLLFFLVPLFKLWGAMFAVVVSQIIIRLLIIIRAKYIQKVPFNDGNTLICMVFVIASVVLQGLFWDYLLQRILIFSILLLIYVFFVIVMYREVIMILIKKIKEAKINIKKNEKKYE